MPERNDARYDSSAGRNGDRRPRTGAPTGRRAAGGRSQSAGRDSGGRHTAGPERPRAVARNDEPELPEDLRPNDLEKSARIELKTLSKENADEVARHLAMASRMIDDDPALAHRHALAAGRRAGRIAIVRETVAITAYAVGDFGLALRELRTFRRISGSDDQIGLMVDSERGLGRPDRALELGRTVDRSTLPVPAQVSLAIAMSGARLDLEDPAAALDELLRAPLDTDRLYPWSPGLYAAFAAVHEDLGAEAESLRWATMAERAADQLDTVDAEDDSVSITTELFDEPESPAAETPGVETAGIDPESDDTTSNK